MHVLRRAPELVPREPRCCLVLPVFAAAVELKDQYPDGLTKKFLDAVGSYSTGFAIGNALSLNVVERLLSRVFLATLRSTSTT